MQWYRQALGKAVNKEVDWNSDNIRLTLHTSAYVPNLDTHDYVDDLTGELPTANGYTVGGIQLASPTVTYTAANSWADAWAASTAYATGYVVRPSTGNGFLYRVVGVGGSSGAAEPAWPTVVGQDVADGTVTWECVGSGVLVLGAIDVEWDPATFTAVRHLVLSERTPGTTATQPLVAVRTLAADNDADGIFRVIWDAQGILHIYLP